MSKQLNSSHPFLIIASDGVWEFLTSQSVVDMVRAAYFPFLMPVATTTATTVTAGALIPSPSFMFSAWPLHAQVSKFDDPQEACFSVVAESYRLWLSHETRTDDITMLVIQFQGLADAAPQMALPTPQG